MQFTIRQGMNQDILKEYPDNYFDSIVTDPPYGIEFLGKDWDKNTGAIETWQECFRVLKPGGHILAFSAARTYHHLATNIESVGFEIRDQIMWIYGSGFPKAQDIGKAIQRRQGVEETKTHKKLNGYAIEQTAHGAQRVGDVNADDYEKTINETVCTSPEAQQWEGWKTALKPAHEPIVMARKPFKGSTIDNVLEHGVGALNIDATRVGDEVLTYDSNIEKGMYNGAGYKYGNNADKTVNNIPTETQGRFPSNVVGEIPDYQKYFYCPKVSRAERHCGFEQLPPSAGTTKMYGPEQAITRNTANMGGTKKGKNAKGSLDHIPSTKGGMWDVDGSGTQYNRAALDKKTSMQKGSLDHIPAPFGDVQGAYVNGERMAKVADDTQYAAAGNNHPTVKPVELMKYLIKLVTPAGGKVLDPFNGSGSTGMAAVELGYEYTGCELDPNYVAIAERRIQGWYERTRPDTNFNELFE